MRELARVQEAGGGKATVALSRKKGCSSCNACGMGSGDEVLMVLDNPVGAKSGDMVELYVSSRRALLASFIAYGFPLIMMILGALVGHFLPVLAGLLWPRDWVAAGGALLFTALGWCIIMLNSAKIKKAGIALSIIAVAQKSEDDDKNNRR